MLGIFNSYNFIVCRGNDSNELYKQASISYNEFEYGKLLNLSKAPISKYMDEVYISFGPPSFRIQNVIDGPVECWVISSPCKKEIIYIEHWKRTYPERMYIFMNKKNEITSLFLKKLYECTN